MPSAFSSSPTKKHVDPDKHNDRVAAFGNDASEARYVSTTKHPASALMLGAVASNVGRMPTVWFKAGYRLTAADYRDILATKVLP